MSECTRGKDRSGGGSNSSRPGLQGRHGYDIRLIASRRVGAGLVAISTRVDCVARCPLLVPLAAHVALVRAPFAPASAGVRRLRLLGQRGRSPQRVQGPVHELHKGHRRGVADAGVRLEHARVAAGPVLVSLREDREELDQLRPGGDILARLHPRVRRALLAKVDHAIGDSPQLARARVRRLDPLVLDEGLDEVPQHRPPVRPPPPKPGVEAEEPARGLPQEGAGGRREQRGHR
mmetsp:Transcript_16574/g.47850  ORF Transcript_16574/g.47850 Transcript_16574/m.47850 type:complete len:234 (+) Transcript_16574:99-800(+)